MSKIVVNQVQKSGGVALTLPTSDGSSGHFLKTDGAGQLAFAASGLPSPGTSGQVLVSNGSAWNSTTLETSADPKVLYKCSGWDGSGVSIPSNMRGKYTSYEIQGQVGYWQWYCSQLTFGFAGACSGNCSANFQDYCCAHWTCGWVGDVKCNNGTNQYTCAGAIAWPFGCDSGCMTACSYRGWQFHIALNPWGYSGDGNKQAHYCINTTNNGGGEYCCMGVRNVGELRSCCGGDTGCLTSVCFTSPSGSNGVACCSSIVVIGRGKLV